MTPHDTAALEARGDEAQHAAPTSAVQPGARRAALAFIFVTVAIDVLSFGVIIPVLPHLVRSFVGGDTGRASVWAGLFSTVFSITQFVFSPIQGTLSDRFGRRPVILLSCLGLGLDFLLMAVARTLPWLMIGRVLSGVTSASFSTANAYIADVTPPQRRAGAFGMVGAAFGLGFVVGPVIGSVLSRIDVRAPFVGAAALALCNFAYGLFVLPESLPVERRAARFDWSHANPLSSLLRLRAFPQVFGLAFVAFLSALAQYALQATFVLYADHRYHWGSRTVGYVLGAVGIASAIVQGGLAGRVVARLGERRTIALAAVSGTLGFTIYGLAPTGALFLVGVPVMSLWGLGTSAIQSAMSKQVDPSEQGRLQGAISSLSSLGGIFAPFTFASVFAWAIGPHAPVHMPGAAFVLAALLVLAGGVIGWRVTKPRAA